MGLIDLLLLLLVAGLCGALGQAIVGYNHGGFLVSVAIGIIGALVGFWLARTLGLPEPFVLQFGDQPFPVIWSIAGSALFVAILSLFTRPRRVHA